MRRDVGSLHIGAGHRKMPVDEHFGKAAHADAADADKVDVYWCLKVYLVHFLYLCSYKIPRADTHAHGDLPYVSVSIPQEKRGFKCFSKVTFVQKDETMLKNAGKCYPIKAVCI